MPDLIGPAAFGADPGTASLTEARERAVQIVDANAAPILRDLAYLKRNAIMAGDLVLTKARTITQGAAAGWEQIIAQYGAWLRIEETTEPGRKHFIALSVPASPNGAPGGTELKYVRLEAGRVLYIPFSAVWIYSAAATVVRVEWGTAGCLGPPALVDSRPAELVVTGACKTVNATTSSGAVVAANRKRIGLSITNNGAADVWITAATTAVSGRGTLLAPRGVYERFGINAMAARYSISSATVALAVDEETVP